MYMYTDSNRGTWVTMEFGSSRTLRLVVGDLEHSNDASCKGATTCIDVDPLPNMMGYIIRL